MRARIAIGVTLIFGGALPAGAALVPSADCGRGLSHFSTAFTKYFSGVTQKYLGPNGATLKRTLGGGPGAGLEELELFATPGLPAGYPAREARMNCWIQIYDYLSVLERGKIGEAEAHLADWRNCVGGVYGGNFPSVAMELLECAGKARAASLPKVLPSAVKKAEGLTTP